MTKAEIKYVLEACNEKLDVLTPLLNIRYITITKLEHKVCQVNEWRFYFDSSNEVLLCYPVDEYFGDVSKLSEDDYDTYDGKNYIYLKDSDGNKLVDCYDFETIAIIAPEVTKEVL